MGNQQACSGSYTAASNPSNGPLGGSGSNNSNGNNDPNIKQAGVNNNSTLLAVPKKKPKALREKNRFGTVIVKVASLSSNRRVQERQNIFTITPRGGLFHGTQCNPSLVQKVLQSADFAVLPPVEISLGDSRAHKLLVVHTNGWHAIPAPETFSRHSGTCVILGDRNNTGPPFPIKLGDCFRLGSVGLVVSELRTVDGEEQRLDSRMLQYLKDEALEFDTTDEMAALAADEEKAGPAKSNSVRLPGSEAKLGIANGEKFICYMCYETHDTAEDPLVAPCDCKGDTRYLHVQCLQKWYHSSICGPTARVIRTTGNGAPACKICGTAYKTAFRKPDGRTANLLEMETAGPYLSLVVVTRHDTNPALFNTKFRLNFGRMANSPQEDTPDMAAQPNALIIGRSSSCSMVLDYRTVSTVHAILYYNEGRFFLQDRRSSNGTMVYLQEPLELPFSHPVRLRMGRSTLSIQAKRNWMTSVRGAFGTIRSTVTHPTPEELMTVFSLSNVNSNDRNNQSFLGPISMQPGGSMGALGLHSNPVGSSASTALSVQPNGSYGIEGMSSHSTGSIPRRAAAMTVSFPTSMYSDPTYQGDDSNQPGSSGSNVRSQTTTSTANEQTPLQVFKNNRLGSLDTDLSQKVSSDSNRENWKEDEQDIRSMGTSRGEEHNNEGQGSSRSGSPLLRTGYSSSNVHANGNIVLTDGAMADMEGSSTLMVRQYVEDVVRTTSPSPSRVCSTNVMVHPRSGGHSNNNQSNDLDFTDAISMLSECNDGPSSTSQESLLDAASLSMIPPAAVAFSTPHNSGKHSQASNPLEGREGNVSKEGQGKEGSKSVDEKEKESMMDIEKDRAKESQMEVLGKIGGDSMVRGAVAGSEAITPPSVSKSAPTSTYRKDSNPTSSPNTNNSPNKDSNNNNSNNGSNSIRKDSTSKEGRGLSDRDGKGGCYSPEAIASMEADEETRLACSTPMESLTGTPLASKRNSLTAVPAQKGSQAGPSKGEKGTEGTAVNSSDSYEKQEKQGGSFSPYFGRHRKSVPSSDPSSTTKDNASKDQKDLKDSPQKLGSFEELLSSRRGLISRGGTSTPFTPPAEDTVRLRANSDSTISEPDRDRLTQSSPTDGMSPRRGGGGSDLEVTTDAFDELDNKTKSGGNSPSKKKAG